MSKGDDYEGGWNKGPTPELGEEWQYIENPLEHVLNTNGLLEEVAEGTDHRKVCPKTE